MSNALKLFLTFFTRITQINTDFDDLSINYELKIMNYT
jgi:hypothetical protein